MATPHGSTYPRDPATEADHRARAGDDPARDMLGWLFLILLALTFGGILWIAFGDAPAVPLFSWMFGWLK